MLEANDLPYSKKNSNRNPNDNYVTGNALEAENSCTINYAGCFEAAQKNFKKMFTGSLAYQGLIEACLKDLNKNHVDELQWQDIPITTKKSFYSAHPWHEVLPKESYKDVYTILRSSGTTSTNGTGTGFFWPQLKSEALFDEPGVRATLVDAFQMKQNSTLAIVGLSLGSWAGGEQTSFALKNLALSSNFPLVVFSPGNQHAEIIELIEKCQDKFSQIIIALCPSAIFYLERLAHKMQVRLPLEKISFLVAGEPFPEALRLDLQSRAGMGNSNNGIQRQIQAPVMLSVYGSADTGVLGVESQELVTLRQVLSKHPDMAIALGLTPYAIPNLFHLNSSQAFIEPVNDELVITRWQGLPLIRYNLQDKIKLFSWNKVCTLAAAYDKSQEQFWTSLKDKKIPDIIAVWGRSKGCLFLCGSNIFESMLQEVVLRSSLAPLSTGAFVVWEGIDKGQQVLNWQIELKPGVSIPTHDIHSEFVTLLSKQQPEFASDYDNFYRPCEVEGLRIFRFHFCNSPTLSEHPEYNKGIKKKVIVENGPIE